MLIQLEIDLFLSKSRLEYPPLVIKTEFIHEDRIIDSTKVDYRRNETHVISDLKSEWRILNTTGFVATSNEGTEIDIVLIVLKKHGYEKIKEDIEHIRKWVNDTKADDRKNKKYKIVQVNQIPPEEKSWVERILNGAMKISPLTQMLGVGGVGTGPFIIWAIWHFLIVPFLPHDTYSRSASLTQHQSQPTSIITRASSAATQKLVLSQPPHFEGAATVSQSFPKPVGVRQEPQLNVGASLAPVVQNDQSDKPKAVVTTAPETLQQILNSYLRQQLGQDISEGKIINPHLQIISISPVPSSNGTAQCTIDGGISSDHGETLPTRQFPTQSSGQGDNNEEVMEDACRKVVSSMIDMLHDE